MAKLQAQNGQSPSRSSPRNLNLHRGADNLAYEPTSPTSLTDIGGPKEEDDYELANSIKEQLKGQRYTPSPHQSLKSESIQNSPNSARKMPQEKIAQVERIAVIPSERLPQRPARRLTKETTFDAISTAEPATSVNFVDSSRHSGGHGVNNESFRM